MAEVQVTDTAIGRPMELARRLAQSDGFVEVFSRLGAAREATIDGAWGSARALAVAAILRRAAGPVLIVCPRPADVESLADDLSLFSDQPPCQFPAREVEAGEKVLFDEAQAQRLRILKQLESVETAPVLIASIQSLLQPVPTQADLRAATRTLRVGQRLDADELLAWLVAAGFENTSAVELPGEFAVRGGILDIFAGDWDDPVRIELFGDEIESIRQFTVADQRSLGQRDEIDITALGAQTAGAEHLAAYLPPETIVVLVEPAEVETEGRHFHERSDDADRLHSTSAVFQRLYKFPIVTLEAMAAGTLGDARPYRLPVESVERFSGDIHRVRDEIDGISRGQDVMVVCQTEAECKRLTEVFSGTESYTEGRLHFLQGRLRQGFRLLDQRLVLVSGNELFHRTEIARPTRKPQGRVIDSFLDLREGDLVVHLAHGIARYRGLKLLDRSHGTEEHLELEFDGGTKIYVPASKINLVQKYIGGTKARPSLAKIGGKSWVRQKQAAQSAVSDLAADMLELQAAREARPGLRFAADTTWQQEFDAAFPYRETPDQLTAIDAIKQDMHKSRPMDRLLCGDVGFGKTELAIRAAFKAVDNGYQVGVLAPTTVLVEQHFRTFSERMAEFPFEIARLSRFCTTKEQNDIIAALELGSIDIVIGTHRLASQDVKFHNLGLLIIDEEQKFGVEVKERLKSLRTTVDVLTMTATPIPRTLHLSLLGIRDISNLETPPDDRIAVETRVTRWEQNLIRHAILREINRGGQVYFVHNRVADIENVAARLREIVPEASIRIGHGQMAESELEQVMLDFVDHRFDVLLATTIIESGLDIPNANTMFIDEAHRYGLADLHQLRGRVGRYKHRAYCYLLVDPHRHLTPDATRRLRAIEEYSRLGAGFAIAMRDLEIRGAGNILGTQQSGHIAAVGYELYCQMLEGAVRRLKSLPGGESVDVDIDLPVEAFIPPSYVPDLRLKIDLYRRLARTTTDEQLADFAAELTDRFGRIPSEVERLLALAGLRIAAGRWHIDAVHFETPYLKFDYILRRTIDQLAAANGRRLRVVDDRSAYLTVPEELRTSDGLLGCAKSVLRPE
jgi:transcription-repair coupling factor (superfamily II helicase)